MDTARARCRACAPDRTEHRPRRRLRRAGACRSPRAARAVGRVPVNTPAGGRPATEGPPAPGRVWQPGAANSAAPELPPPCGRPCSVPAATIPPMMRLKRAVTAAAAVGVAASGAEALTLRKRVRDLPLQGL